jgi:hypothetical protein
VSAFQAHLRVRVVCSLFLQDMILSLARTPFIQQQQQQQQHDRQARTATEACAQQQQVPLARRGSVLTMAEGTALARPRFGSFNQVTTLVLALSGIRYVLSYSISLRMIASCTCCTNGCIVTVMPY